MKDEIKELKYIIYLKSVQIKQLKKEIKDIQMKINELEGIKTLRRKK